MAINYGKLNAKMNPRGSMIAHMGVSGPLNSDYEALINKPQINGNELVGNKTNEDLGIPTKTSDLDNDLNFVADENYVHTDNNYDDTDKGKVDALGTASTKDVPAEGNASASEVVMGGDTRLTDSRNAKDVYDWAKAQTKPSYSYSEIQNTPAINNSTITFQKNNQNVDSFTLNQDSNKSINISVPTKTSDLQNDNSFITNTVNNLANYYLKTQTYTQAEVDALIQAAINGRFQKVNTLPASGEPNVIYLVPKTTPETSNACDEYIWQDNAWELIGSTEIDLSDYVTNEDLATALQSYLTTSAFATAIANYYTKTEVGTLLNDKVDKVNGKGLSTYDYDATAKAIVDSVTANLATKVDKVAGKGLSTNDYDNTAKNIVDGVTSALAGKVDKVNGKGLSTNDYTTEEKTKLTGISEGANKVESSETNGNIQIDGTETQVYDDTAVTNAISGLNENVEDIQDVITTDTPPISGNPISISGLKSTQLAVEPVITFEPIQAGSGTPSPENIRAISGYDKIEVLSCGNLFDGTFQNAVLSAGTTWQSSANGRTAIIKVKPNSYYTVYKNGGNRFYISDANEYPVENGVYNLLYDGSSTTTGTRTVLTSADAEYLLIYCDVAGANNIQLQVEYGQTTPTTFTPYHKTTDLSESLGQTVYGGTLDVRTGKLPITLSDKVDLGDLDWNYTNGYFYASTVGIQTPKDYANGVCECYTIWQGTISDAPDCSIRINTSNIYVKDSRYTSSTDLKNALDGLGLVYKLATPITIQLTPHEISLLEQYAYVSTNGTSIALSYHQGEMASLGDVAESELYTMSWVKKLMTRLSSVRLYAFHIDGATGEVTYLEDNANYTPAYMDYTKGSFNYASWQDAFFMPKPCVLGMDGHVKCYLDPYNYAKDIDGNTVAIDSTLTDGNVMIEFPKIWSKVVPDAGDPASATVYICNQQIDDEFKDYAYIDSAGTHKEHMYTPAYNGSYDSNNKMRSISGAQVGKTLSGTTEIERAEANGAGWYTEDAGEVMLINFLLILMGKSVDTQTVFGQGLHTGGNEAINDGFRTGVHNTKGLFYGTNSGAIASGSYGNAVKVFGMENWWGFQWRRYAGDMLVDGVIKVKMCKGRNDGSTVSGYNTDATGYISTGVTPSGTSGGYITTMNFNKYGMFSSVSASSSTTYKDGQWYNTGTRYAFRGGASNYGAPVGAFCVSRHSAVSYAAWIIGAALSFK